MEAVNGRNKAQKDDIISRMPENVITNIIDRLPIEAAVGTSILSRKWRFKWTLLTRLIFDLEFYFYLCKKGNYDFVNIVSRLLLHHMGPITTCILFIEPNFDKANVEQINHWVMYLLRKGIKDLTLANEGNPPLKLPTHLFSCPELKELKLYNCCLHPPATFFGFPNLLNLELFNVTGIFNCVERLINCPLLEILKIRTFKPIRKVKLGEIAKLKNLTVLSLPLSMLDDVTIMFQLGGYLPKLQELNLQFRPSTFLEEADMRKWVCAAFPYLKTLFFDDIDLSSNLMLSFAFAMICGSPNLQTLKICAECDKELVPSPAFCFPEVHNNSKSQLQNVVLYNFRGSENEVNLIKYVLDCSPFLEKIEIFCKSFTMVGGQSGKLSFATKLLELHRASPLAEVKLCWL